MAERITSTGIRRDPDLMYYIKGGDVWASPRKKPGKAKGKARRVLELGLTLDYSRFLYYLDDKLNVMRSRRKN
jgi:hypothetical protein